MYSRVAKLKGARGDDPAPDHARAIQSYQQGAAVSPGNSYFPNAISKEHLDLAQEARDHGRDPMPDLALALAAARRVVEVAPDDGSGYLKIGCALLDRADYQRLLGVDPLPAVREAEAAFTQALDHLSDPSWIWWNLADLHILVAGVELDRGHVPRDRLRLAEEAIDRAQALDPSKAFAQERRAKIRALRDRWQARQR